MAYARTRKHYRVAKKEAETAPNKGIFISNEHKKKGLIILSVFIAVVFVKGFLFGYIAGRDHV